MSLADDLQLTGSGRFAPPPSAPGSADIERIVTAALARLDAGLLREQALIDGQWRDAPGHVPVTDPGSGVEIGRVPDLDAAATREAIEAARAAGAGWRALLPQERAEILLAWYTLILEHKEDLALLLTLEQGKPLAESRGEIDYGASFVRWFAEEGRRSYGRSIPSHLPGRRMFTEQVPVGVVACVTPWNFPSAMLARKAAAALAAGCTVIGAPSPETPLSALALGELAQRAGFPHGVFNLVTGQPQVVVGELCAHPEVRALSFTGSTEIGRLLLAQCAPTVKRMSLELGGHAPFIGFADAGLDALVRGAMDAKYATSGQDCLAANRIYIERSIHADFLEAFSAASAGLAVGHGLTDDTEIGPLMHERALARVEAQVEDAVARGARLTTGGYRRDDLGSRYYAPTVLADVPAQARIMVEETFGPVAAVVPFDAEEAVIEAANASEYGLCAYLYTRDADRLERVASRLEYGMLAINGVRITGAPIPFGGVRQSGLGREGATEGLAEFTETRYRCIAPLGDLRG